MNTSTHTDEGHRSYTRSQVSLRLHSPTFAAPRLPPELCDIIIDNLCGDKKSLSACTLVSSAWKRTARHHLFESVLVARQDDRDAYQHFLEFLQNTPGIGPDIRIICIDGYNPEESVHGELDARFMANIVEQVPGLKALLLLNCGWQRTPLGSMDFYKRPKRFISDLYINSFRGAKGPPSSKLDILRHFERIENLYLTRLWLGHFDVDGHVGDTGVEEMDLGEPLEPLSVQVTHLTLCLADICLNFLEYLRRQPFVTSLASLTIRDLWAASYLENHEDLFIVGDIIRDKMGASLKTLEIDLPRHTQHDSPDIFMALHLESCVSLTKVTINLMLESHDRLITRDTEQHDHGEEDDAIPAYVGEYEVDSEEEVEGEIEGDDMDDDVDEYLDEDADNDDAVIEETENIDPVPSSQQSETDNSSPEPPEVAHIGIEEPELPARQPELYTANEWRVLCVILSQLPPSVTDITVAIELTGPAHDVSRHLLDFPRWDELEQQLLRLPDLKNVHIRRLEKMDGEVPVFRKWSEVDQQDICSRLSRVFAKKVLEFDS